MADRTYIVTLDPSDPTIDLDGLRDFVKTSPRIENWWNHIPFVFLVTSELGADDLGEALRHYTKDARFLVMAVDPEASDGWLTEKGWQWIRRRAKPSRAARVLAAAGRADTAGRT